MQSIGISRYRKEFSSSSSFSSFPTPPQWTRKAFRVTDATEKGIPRDLSRSNNTLGSLRWVNDARSEKRQQHSPNQPHTHMSISCCLWLVASTFVVNGWVWSAHRSRAKRHRVLIASTIARRILRKDDLWNHLQRSTCSRRRYQFRIATDLVALTSS